MLNRIMLLLADVVCYLALGAGLYEVTHAVKYVAPVSVNGEVRWPLMHPSAAKFMLPQGAASKEKE